MAIVAARVFRSGRVARLMRGASATALWMAALPGVAQAQVTGPVVDGANATHPTGARSGPGTAGAASPSSADTGTSATTVPAGEAPSAGTPVAAEDAGANGPNEVVVTGIRQSLANAQNIKRNSDTIVDAITATDIGALPDRSVTEALQRVPGVEINRFAGNNDPDHFSVEGSGVSVRGLNFVRSEFNGRDTFSAGVGGQAINFSDVPAELLGSVEVYKNATAEQIEGGLAGTVNLNTRKPFDNNGFHFAIDGEGNHGDLEKRWSPTGSFLISNTWDTDSGKFGLLADVSYSQLRYRTDGIQVTNVQTRDGTVTSGSNNSGTTCRNALPGGTDTTTLPAAGSCAVTGTPGADGFADLVGPRYAPIGGNFRQEDFNRKRQGIAVAAQWQSSDERALLTFQYLRSHSSTAGSEHTQETGSDLSEYNTYPYGCQQNTNALNGVARAECPTGALQNYAYDSSGLFQSGYITYPGTGYRTADSGSATSFVPTGGTQQVFTREQTIDKNTINDFGFNAKISPTDHLSFNIDGDYTHAVHDNEDINVFGSNFADEELDLSGKLPVVVPHKPATLNAAWATPNPELVNDTDQQYFQDKNVEFWRAAMDHFEHSKGREYAFKGDLDYKFDEGGFLKDIKFGARYADRDETVRYSTYNYGALSEVWAGTPVSIAQQGGKASFYDFPNFYRGDTPGPVGAYYYSGDLIKDYNGSVDYFRQIEQQWAANGSTATPWSPLADRAGVVPGTPYLPSEIQKVAEEDTDAYAQLNFATPGPLFGDVRISGNVGVRYVSSRITSQGSIGAPTAQQLGVQDPYDVQCAVRTVTLPTGETQVTQPTGICLLGPTGYGRLQQFATGQTLADTAINRYHYFLPSANLKVGLTRNLLFRLAGSKVLTRPDLANIRDFITVGFDPNSGTPTATAGNPFLKPATAWQFDATLEWYFGRVGQLSIDGFYKSVHNFFYQSLINRDITSNGITETVQVRGPANYNGYGKIKGFEASYQQTFDFLPKPLDGLGLNLNYTFIESSGLPNAFLNTGAPDPTSTITPGKLPFEGLSKSNVNATAFYEKGPISLRLAYDWRSKFLLTAADVIFPYTSIFQHSGGQLDGSLFFNVNKYVKVGVQGVNLNNQVTRLLQAYTGDPHQLAPRSYFINDRRYSFIVRANF